MLTRTSTSTSLKRAALLTTIAAISMTMAQPSMAATTNNTLATNTTLAGVSAKAGTSDMTDISSQRRRYSRGGNGGAAAAAAFAGIVGTAIIASQANRGYGYYDGGPYDSYAYSPGYYGGSPAYYGGGGYYRGYGRDRSQLGGQGRNGQLYPNW